MSEQTTHLTTARIEADPELPVIRITRDFRATPAQLFRAHTDPELYARWVGPHELGTRIEHWEATRGGSWRFVNTRTGEQGTEEYAFYGSFHELRPDELIVQTFTFTGMPDGVALEKLVLEDPGDGRTRLTATSLCDSFADRDGMLSSGMDVGVNEGYAKLDALLAGS